MLRLRSRRWRSLAAVLAASVAAPALVIGSAGAAQADLVRQQELWVLNAINVAGAWQRTHGAGVTVGLIDSGVNGQVSDLTGSVITGRNFSGVNTPSSNSNWGVHGTWMASLIAGHGHPPDSTSGIMGVAPAAKILSIRAVTDQGDPGYRRYQHESESRVQGRLAGAIQYATSKGVDVISMSLGYQGASLPVRRAIAAALAKGIVVVASSGNSGGVSSGQPGNAPYSFPADYPGVLGVGAVDRDGGPAGFSSDNLSVQVAAPGVRVPAQGRDGQYWLVSGTSPACALTAGVAALIKSVYPALAPALVVQAITESTWNKPHGGYDEQVGFGTVDATAALRMAGRLARDKGTGHGLVEATQFGGGPAAVPPVPVAPRGRGQFVVDSLIALACLAFVLVAAFRLIVTRRRAPALAGAPGAWTGAGPGPPDSPGPGAPGSGAPGLGAPGLAVPGPAVPGSGAGAAWPDAGGPGYGHSPDYWTPGGYKPQPAGYPPPAGYEPATSVQQPYDPGPGAGYPPPAGYGSSGAEQPREPGYPPAGGYGSSAGVQQPGGPGYPVPAAFESSAGTGQPGEPGYPPPAGYGSSAGIGQPREPGPTAEYPASPAGPWPPREPGRRARDGRAVGYSPWSASQEPPSANGRPAGYGPPAPAEPPAGPEPSGRLEPPGGDELPAGPGVPGIAGAPPDDDTWPSAGQW